MIKISFNAKNTVDDICEILQNELTDKMNIEDWLIKEVHTLRFDCMDFPHDLESFYDCYFSSTNEEVDAYHLCFILKHRLKNIKSVQYSVCIVSKHLEFIKEIECCKGKRIKDF